MLQGTKAGRNMLTDLPVDLTAPLHLPVLKSVAIEF